MIRISREGKVTIIDFKRHFGIAWQDLKFNGNCFSHLIVEMTHSKDVV